LYRQIRDAILDGRIRAREALPSSRELARRLDVCRNTVLVVYERLRAEGFLEPRVGAGTFVRDGFRPRSVVASNGSALRPRAIWDAIPEGLDLAATNPEFDFRPGLPDASRFPFPAWRARVARQLHPRAVGSGGHIAAAGDRGLRSAIARHIGVSRAVRCGADDIVVTNGSQQAIDLIARVLLEPGDTVAVEDPGYTLPRRVFQAHGCRVVGVPVDEDGLVVESIPEHARLVYVTPSHQYPLGMVLSMARRQALLAWAQRADAAIIEDDYDSEFRYGQQPLETLQNLDRSGRVLYVGSFSKVMLPTLRLGFLVTPAPLRSALRKAKTTADWHTAAPSQGALAQFIDDGLLAQHIRRIRPVYAERHERIQTILAKDFAGRLTPLPSSGGLHLSALLRDHDGPGDVTVVERARGAGVSLLPLSTHCMSRERLRGLIFGYGAIDVSRIGEGLRRLAACL
jgi:GntR family transcriptional regulator/MocR family aminotransferase